MVVFFFLKVLFFGRLAAVGFLGGGREQYDDEMVWFVTL